MIIEKLLEAKNLNKVTIIKDALDFSGTYSDLEHYRIKLDKRRKVRWDNNNLSIAFETDGSPFLQDFSCFSTFRNALYSVWADKVWDEPALIMSDIIGEGSGLNFHADPCPQIHWSCIGNTIWRVEEENSTKEYYINPGDIIYIPTGIKHKVESLTAPRAGIAYSIRIS